MNNTKNNKIKDKRAFNLKLLSIGSVIILLVIILASNILFDKLLGKPLTFDFSMFGRYSITQKTQEVIDKIPEGTTVRIVGLYDVPDNLENSVLEYTKPLLDAYDAYGGDRLTVEYIDPKTYPSIISQLDPSGANDLKENVYVVKYGDNLKVINPKKDCFNFDSQAAMYGYEILTANLVEYTFTNAVNNLLTGFTKHAYFITGLQEDNSTQIKAVLSSMGCDSKDLPVSDDLTIPEDCDILFLNGINTDIPERLQTQLVSYIEGGGNVIIAVNYYANTTEPYEKLNTALDKINIKIDSYVIQENNADYVLGSNNFQYLVDVADDFKDFSSKDQLYSGFARPVRTTDSAVSYVSTYPVLTTSDKASAVVLTDDGQLDLVNEGQYNVGMFATFNEGDVRPQVYVFGTTDLTSDDFISNYSFSHQNVEFIRSCFRNMLNIAAADEVDVPAVAIEDFSIDSERAASSSVTVMALIFVAVIPLALIIVATVVYTRRKHL
ncbi:MAG: Gldg family protein [Clostridiales bacterium]|nr:Gldg family protein [Clostridiales bacterium]